MRFTNVAPVTSDNASFVPSPAIAYDLGNLVAQSGTDNSILITPVRGWVRYPIASTALPRTTTRFPVIVFLHGNHDPRDPSYQGYDYLAQDLASQGYVAVSIDANAINGNSPGGIGSGDPSSRSRGQLILGTLDRLREIDKRGGPGMLDQLKDKLDLTRIGMMGHSRGGEGISNAIKYNLTRVGVTEEDLRIALQMNAPAFAHYPDLAAAVTISASGTAELDRAKFSSAIQKYNIYYSAGAESTPPYHFKAGLLVAPTDFSGNLGLVNVPLALLLPSCDGDVFSLEGARTFDRNRFSAASDTSPRYQILVRGANHNFYNTLWTHNDADVYRRSDYCANRPGSVRLNSEDQRRSGQFLINSFMRHFVGGEQKFAGYWNGTAQLPAAACPGGVGTCDERVVLTIQKGSHQSKLVQRFDQTDSLSFNALGGGVALTGFDNIASCQMPYGIGNTMGACIPDRLEDFEYPDAQFEQTATGFRSVADHLELSWSKPGATFVTNLQGMSAVTYDALTFRVAVIRPMGQEIAVTLTDTAGRTATVTASDFSDALYLAPKPKRDGLPMTDAPDDILFANGSVVQLLNMVAIPLKAFPGVDHNSLKELKLVFPKAAGKAALTDIEFQHLGRS
ncbi:alpha/beta hydrolase family protein [Chitinimonas sp. PSY-7]|uniref:alpha/beta hydrolase family protein n=1 Tax=Chitinimonas sp. PSY-7 TaxID=3459088 RepID=UPI00403FEB9B